ncbi:hypothetical protein OO013_17550 [Mangrovivirga sp. M17]|uniref:Uncharacterized protein n=1 Tax=Mangrovivirga halotolerans TaxID=2993936 RepID=A0ABT3RVV2_9BACT|nr:hypothetical protein [Mangrovivirga halotolerans]MCX2745692.1 hypothetical protein [Mangrovivirga halotolerans]
MRDIVIKELKSKKLEANKCGVHFKAGLSRETVQGYCLVDSGLTLKEVTAHIRQEVLRKRGLASEVFSGSQARGRYFIHLGV